MEAYMDEQLDLAGIPEGEEVIHGDDPGVAEPVAEDGEGITDVLLQSLHSSASQRVRLVLIELDQHRQCNIIASL
jgi:hypothetical protein